MKKSVLLFAVILISSFSAVNANVPTTEPLLLAPLSTTVLSSSPATYDVTTVDVQTKSPIGGGVYEATYTPNMTFAENMVPQNAAAKGEPVPAHQEPRVRIQTKQQSQGIPYWNPGGKGVKTFY